jgi:hypothetical protein
MEGFKMNTTENTFVKKEPKEVKIIKPEKGVTNEKKP